MGGVPSGVGTIAYGASADGSVIVGGEDSGQAFRWTSAGGYQQLGVLPEDSYSVANAVSADGSVVVGGSGPSTNQAFRWTLPGGIEGLGYLPADTFSVANGVSDDGLVIVGKSSGDSNGAFRWTEAGGMVELDPLPDPYSDSEANDVSGNGLIAVGRSGGSAVRWLPDGTVESLGSAAIAYSSNYDGSVIVGFGNNTAFVWSEAWGMQDLKGVLQSGYGLDLTGWDLGFAYGISSDGSTIVGFGQNPDGQSEAWVVTGFVPIPEPTPGVLVAVGLVMAGFWKVRRASRAV